jgi:hypothetical protein
MDTSRYVLDKDPSGNQYCSYFPGENAYRYSKTGERIFLGASRHELAHWEEVLPYEYPLGRRTNALNQITGQDITQPGWNFDPRGTDAYQFDPLLPDYTTNQVKVHEYWPDQNTVAPDVSHWALHLPVLPQSVPH